VTSPIRQHQETTVEKPCQSDPVRSPVQVSQTFAIMPPLTA